ncbi:hypothetical protein LTSEINV_0994 [Salmonella enterica subsp. enterica serovar Inverness str. R8-3668]|uniref:Uncharacterized protein n=1 Tax=Salmonella enterica subsp. enterica serovar Inverness str. R8-3668 TaxID=913075 RepID=G5N9D9_SALET|nr:hypothetical protein LTSEINV_0994 [Salmonella enterica subsp. enterica serovar Inverness str. R8-3668]
MFRFFSPQWFRPLTAPDRLLFSAARLFSPCRALQKLFYKNGDAFCDVGWDDNLVLNADPAT